MPLLIRYMLSQFCNGAVAGLGFALALLYSDVGGLGRLTAESADSGGVTLLFFLQGALVFGCCGLSLGFIDLPDQR